MKKDSGLYFLVLILGGSYTLFCIHHYHLIGQTLNFNDSNFYYLTAASLIWNGAGIPRFGHPGLFFANLLACGLALFKKLSLLPSLTLTDFTQSPDPLGDLRHLFWAGQLIEIGIVLLFLIFTYRISRKITHHSASALFISLYTFLLTGVFESMFMIRSETLSALFVLMILDLTLSIAPRKSSPIPLLVLFVSGFLWGCSLSSKLLALFFLPLLIPFLFPLTQINEPRGRTVMVLAWMSLLILAFPLIKNFHIVSFVPDAYLVQATHHISYMKQGLILLGITSLAPVLLICRPTFQKFYLAGLVFVGGILLSFYTAFLNIASPKKDFTFSLINTAWGETLYDTFSRQRYTNHPPTLNFSLLLNQDFLYFISHSLSFFVLFFAGFYQSSRKNKILLGLLITYLWLFSMILSLRSEHFTYYYQVYLILPMILILSLSFSSLLPWMNLKKTGWFLGVLLSLSFLGDTLQAHLFRDHLFQTRQNEVNEMKILDYWGRGFFFDKVIRPRYCVGLMEREACYKKAGQALLQTINGKS